MCRPYPLGTVSTGPPLPPSLRGSTLAATETVLDQQFWTRDRLQEDGGSTVACDGTFLQRFTRSACMQGSNPKSAFCLGTPMRLQDLCAAYYYRHLQCRTMPHVCKLGYCRQSWSEACRFDLPSTALVPALTYNAETRRSVPRKTHLDDDAYNKATSLPLLVRSLMNTQVNQHHPSGDAPNISYSLKYALKGEPTTKVSLRHESDDLVVKHFKGQFISVGDAVQAHLSDPVVDSTFGNDICPLLYPSFRIDKPERTQGIWRGYALRFPYTDADAERYGYRRHIPGAALQLSILMAPASRFLSVK